MLRRLKPFLFLSVSAVLLVSPFHFGALWALAYVAFIPYFFVLDGKSPGEAFGLSYFWGLVFFLSMGFWLAWVSFLGLMLLTAYLALYAAFFGSFTGYFLNPAADLDEVRLKKTVQAACFIPAFWVAGEYLRGILFSGMPWGLLAYGQWRNLPFIQIADWSGAWGVSYFIVFVNVILFKLLQSVLKKGAVSFSNAQARRKMRLVLGAVLASAVGGVFLYGIFSLNSREASAEPGREKAVLRVSVLQGNIPQDQKWNTRIKDIIFEKYKRLTFMAAVEKSDLIVWPETSFPGYLEDEAVMAVQLRSLARHSSTNVLVGAPTVGNLEEEGMRFYNSAVLYGPDGEERKRYNKVHLVPFGEYVPFENWLGFIRHFVHIGRFSAGQEKTVFSMSSRYQKPAFIARFAALICFEDTFPNLVRGFCKNGADFLVNMTNDAWFGDTTAPYQHAQASVFRAVENRVPVVRAANTGLSCFISPEGRILASVQDKGRETFVTGQKGYDIVLKKGRPFYTRFGDVFVALVFGLCFLAYRERARQHAYTHL